MELTKRQEAICNDLGCNAFGRLKLIEGLIGLENYGRARSELIELANFLPGNLVITIGDDDQQQLDWQEDDE